AAPGADRRRRPGSGWGRAAAPGPRSGRRPTVPASRDLPRRGRRRLRHRWANGDVPRDRVGPVRGTSGVAGSVRGRLGGRTGARAAATTTAPAVTRLRGPLALDGGRGRLGATLGGDHRGRLAGHRLAGPATTPAAR